MSENVESKNKDVPAQNHLSEKVGDILHKERVTKRITLDTISKDLKLNIKYIKAIESSNFKELPPDPYIRVYLRSIANYLMLDSDEILKKFFKEKGISSADLENERTDKLNVDIDRSKVTRAATASEKGVDAKIWIIVIIIICVIVILGTLSKKNNWLQSGLIKKTVISENDTLIPEISEKENPDSLSDTDSVNMPVIEQETVDHEELNKPVDTKKTVFPIPENDSLKLVVSPTTDSVWIQVFSDGMSWKNFLEPSQARIFMAKDSFNVHVGRNSMLQYSLNDEKIIVRGKGIKFFKIDHNGIDMWKITQWRKTFKNRL
ncbi:MAG: helix-turn-helix domain-containing protein [Chitinispirillia bacterium]